MFIDSIGSWRTRPQKSANNVRVHIIETIMITYSNSNLYTPICHFSFSLRFCNAYKTYCKTLAKFKMGSPHAILCRRSRHKLVFPRVVFETRLLLEHVGKVRAQRALLLQFHHVLLIGTVLFFGGSSGCFLNTFLHL